MELQLSSVSMLMLLKVCYTGSSSECVLMLVTELFACFKGQRQQRVSLMCCLPFVSAFM